MALCAGVGGLSLGLRRALPTARTVGYVEREAFAAAVLVARMADSTLDQAPVWDDITTFDGRPWRGVVDIVTAGYPCQPFSVAGKRLGTKDQRHLWPHVRRIIAECEPDYVFLENVPGHINLGFSGVLEDLATLGFHAEWGVFSAAEVGATHLRKRLFCLAYRDRIRGRCVVHTNNERLEGRDVHDNPNKRNAGATSYPPRPDDSEGWRAALEVDESLEPALCRVAHGVTYRVDQLRALGNSVVPAQAALAFRELMGRIYGR